MAIYRNLLGQPIVLDFGDHDKRVEPFGAVELNENEIASEEFSKYSEVFVLEAPTAIHKNEDMADKAAEPVEESPIKTSKKQK